MMLAMRMLIFYSGLSRCRLNLFISIRERGQERVDMLYPSRGVGVPDGDSHGKNTSGTGI